MNLIKSIKFISFITAIFWLIKGFEHITTIRLGYFGIYPRSQDGLIGILTAPFLHGDFPHLISNTVPFMVLGIAILFFYKRIALLAMLLMYISTGVGVWLFARGGSYHIGASGVVYAFASFLFFSGLFRKDIKSLAISLVVVFMYGGLVYGVLPLYPGVSWESHLIGAIMGGVIAYLFRKVKEISDEEKKNLFDSFNENKTGYQNIANKNYKYTYK
jgi:membrane associated rhomboid family serine protease